MPQETIITGSFIWSLEDVKLRDTVLAGGPVTVRGKIVAYAFLCALFAIGFTIMTVLNENILLIFKDPYLFLSIGVFITLAVTGFYIRSSNLKKGFLQSPDNNKRVDLSISQIWIVMKIEGVSEHKWDWKVIIEVQQNPKGFCFFLAEKAGFWIPVRAFQSQEDINSLAEFAKRLTPRFKVLG